MGQVGKLGVAGRMPNYQFDQVKIISHPDVLSIPEVYHTICFDMFCISSLEE